MVLGRRLPGRVGRRRISLWKRTAYGRSSSRFRAWCRPPVLQYFTIAKVGFDSWHPPDPQAATAAASVVPRAAADPVPPRAAVVAGPPAPVSPDAGPARAPARAATAVPGPVPRVVAPPGAAARTGRAPTIVGADVPPAARAGEGPRAVASVTTTAAPDRVDPGPVSATGLPAPARRRTGRTIARLGDPAAPAAAAPDRAAAPVVVRRGMIDVAAAVPLPTTAGGERRPGVAPRQTAAAPTTAIVRPAQVAAPRPAAAAATIVRPVPAVRSPVGGRSPRVAATIVGPERAARGPVGGRSPRGGVTIGLAVAGRLGGRRPEVAGATIDVAGATTGLHGAAPIPAAVGGRRRAVGPASVAGDQRVTMRRRCVAPASGVASHDVGPAGPRAAVRRTRGVPQRPVTRTERPGRTARPGSPRSGSTRASCGARPRVRSTAAGRLGRAGRAPGATDRLLVGAGAARAPVHVRVPGRQRTGRRPSPRTT